MQKAKQNFHFIAKPSKFNHFYKKLILTKNVHYNLHEITRIRLWHDQKFRIKHQTILQKE